MTSARSRFVLASLMILTLVLGAVGTVAAAAPGGAPPVPPTQLRGAPLGSSGAAPLAALRTSALGPYPDVQVNVDPGNVVDEFGPAVAVSASGVIYVVWTGDETQQSVFVARSTDGGATYSVAVRVNDAVTYPAAHSVYQPDIGVDGAGNVYVVWFDYRAWADDNAYNSPINVFLDKSSDGGLTWGTDVQATTNGTGDYPWCFQPYLAIDRSRGNLYVSFTDYDRYYPVGDPGDVCVVRSVDGGQTFDPKVRVDDLAASTLVAQTWSAIAVDPASGAVYVAFEDGRGADTDIYVAASTDSGRTFGANHLATVATSGIQLEPALAVDRAGGVHAVWLDWSDDADPTTAPYLNHVRCAGSAAGAAAFGPAVTVTDQYMNAEWSYDFPARIAADANGDLHVVWFDRRSDTTFCYYDHSSDGGQTFSTDVVLHGDRDVATHALPRIALSANLHPVVTWMDRRNGNGKFNVFATHQAAVTGVAEAAPPPMARVGCGPNPSRGSTTIRYAVTRGADVEIQLYDPQGRAVRTLVDGWRDAGSYGVSWDGRDARGRPAACGVYLCRLRSGGAEARAKLVLTR